MHLDRTQYMPGLVDGLLGAFAGDRRRINVDFPKNIRGEGASMSGECACGCACAVIMECAMYCKIFGVWFVV